MREFRIITIIWITDYIPPIHTLQTIHPYQVVLQVSYCVYDFP